MKKIKFITLLFTIIFLTPSLTFADTPYFLDFKYILNKSTAGNKAQVFLKNKLENGIKKIQVKEKEIQEEEKKIIATKKIISPEDYRKKVTKLRTKVSSLQKERNELLQSVSKQRIAARNKLLKSLNPIIQEYMKKNSISIVFPKNQILIGNIEMDITNDIMDLVNNNLE